MKKAIDSRTIFVVVGRLGKSLTTSKLLPIVATGLFTHIYVFRESEGDPIPSVIYITSLFQIGLFPKMFSRVLQRVYELVQLIYCTKNLNPEIINGYQLFPKGINSFIAAKVTKRKCIVSTIGGIPEIDTYFRCKRLWRAIHIYVLSHSDAVTTKGKTVTDYIIRYGVNPDTIMTFNGAIDMGKFSPDINLERDIDLLFVGQLIELKGPDRFVRIVNKLSLQHPGLKAKILGVGELENQVKRMIVNYSIEDQVSIEGYIDNPEAYFCRSKILVMPSRSEGLSTAMLEAMACGCLPVVSDVGCMNEAAISGLTSYTIKNYLDVDSFVVAISTLLFNDELRSSLAANAINLVRSKYSIKSQSAIFKDVVLMSGVKL